MADTAAWSRTPWSRRQSCGRVTWRGTHAGTFLGLPATGKPVTVTAMHLLLFENGLAAEWWAVPDVYGALTGLGARFGLPKG
ncbi:ester cyclase [Arthrobacter sp. UYCu712]|uniref:ester cyclase n=1 Tax=Arthrobacter sp. UYCu712 TaxID=3156340 RepID=UPI0033968E44